MSIPKEIGQINNKLLDDKFTPTEILWKYLVYMPFFIVSLIVTFVIGIYIIRYTQPIYKVTTRIFIKSNADNKVGGSSRGGGQGGDLIENSLFSSKQVNIDNEIALITTLPLIQKVVQDNHFNYYYYNEGNIRRSEIYSATPFEVIAEKWADSDASCQFYISNLNTEGGQLQFDEQAKKKVKYKFYWNQLLTLRGNHFKIVLRNGVNPNDLKNGNDKEPRYFFTYLSPVAAAGNILGNLLVSPYNAKTTIIKLELKGANVSKCADILNAIVKEYNWQSIEDKSIQLTNTIQFIDQRLNLVTKELGGVETNLKDFKNSNQLIDLTSQSGQATSEKATLEKELTDFGIQEERFKMVEQQVKQMTADKLKYIPSNLGVDGGPHTTVFDTYNALIIRKQKEEVSLGKNSPVLADLNAQLQIGYQNVLQTLSEYERSLNIQRNALAEKNRKFAGLINQIPGQEKTYIEIKRQQNVKEGLYLYLLQKREETAIATSSTVGNYQQLEPASGSSNPLEPNKNRIYIFCIVFGLLIPPAFIYLKELFNDKIRSREDITSRTKTPIIAEIGHMEIAAKATNLVVADKSRNIIAEQFRILRTNLNFLLQEKKTILVTSTVSGEGKSFIALNLAAVLAISGKKVALLEFDLRKPRILRHVGLDKKNIGLSNFLANQTNELAGLFYTLDNYPHLHIYACGPVPPNPSELMLGDRMTELFALLKNEYDYIVVDSAPVGLVSDAFNIMAHAETCVYVVRQRKTLKKQLFFINDLFTSKQLHNVGMVINDVKVGARHGYYGYQYGYGYGQGYGYGGNGEYFDNEKGSTRIGRLYKAIFPPKRSS